MVTWQGEYSSTVPPRQHDAIVIGQIIGLVTELSLIALVLGGRWGGWSSRSLQRLLGLTAVTVVVVLAWPVVVLWVFPS
jgi:hypothetical protein